MANGLNSMPEQFGKTDRFARLDWSTDARNPQLASADYRAGDGLDLGGIRSSGTRGHLGRVVYTLGPGPHGALRHLVIGKDIPEV